MLNFSLLFFAGRAKPVPPPRSHSLEQNNHNNSNSAENSDKKLISLANNNNTTNEGSDASSAPASNAAEQQQESAAKNENLITGKHRKTMSGLTLFKRVAQRSRSTKSVQILQKTKLQKFILF